MTLLLFVEDEEKAAADLEFKAEEAAGMKFEFDEREMSPKRLRGLELASSSSPVTSFLSSKGLRVVVLEAAEDLNFKLAGF
jgi:hypothetical protein